MDRLMTQTRHQLSLLFVVIKRERCRTLSLFLIFISSVAVFNLRVSLHQPLVFFRSHFLTQRRIPAKAPSGGGCDYSYGRWVRDENFQIQLYDENCPFLDPGFRCRQNGRRDVEYLKWSWQSDGCEFPRFNASDFLERSRNGRIVFAGDSIGRNQWESLICLLAHAVTNRSSIFEENGTPITKHKGFLSMKFQEYNLTLEYYRLPFLVIINRPPKDSPAQVRMTIRVDELHWFSRRWAGANVVVFNTGHWWNKEKTIKMGCYFQEGGKLNMTMDVKEAFRRSLRTMKSWTTNSLNPGSTHVFIRNYSPTHYSNGTWDGEGVCDTQIEPEKDYRMLSAEPWHNQYISDVIKEMKYGNGKVQLLNITYLTEFRRDGHPSRYREPGTPATAPQDCSHWCLPGIPDTWNELLYAHLLSTGFRAG